jgi:hypothetical protein
VNRFLHAVLLMLALLFAQGGMLAHAAGHVAVEGHGSDQGLSSDPACGLCVGYAQIAGGGALPDAPGLPVCMAGHAAPDACTALFVSIHAYHSRARAPPFFS